MLNTKYESSEPCSFRVDFWKLHYEDRFLPRDLSIKLIRNIWTIVVGDHPGPIPVEFGQIPISG